MSWKNRVLKSIFKVAFKYCATRHGVVRVRKPTWKSSSTALCYIYFLRFFYENFLKSYTCQSNLLGRYTDILYQNSQLPHHFSSVPFFSWRHTDSARLAVLQPRPPRMCITRRWRQDRFTISAWKSNPLAEIYVTVRSEGREKSEDYCLQVCDRVQFGRWLLAFRICLPPSPSLPKSNVAQCTRKNHIPKMLEIIHQITSHNHSRQNLVYHNVKVNSVATFRLDWVTVKL